MVKNLEEMFDIMHEDTLATTLELGVGYTKDGAPIQEDVLKETCEDEIIANVSFLEASSFVGKSPQPLSIQLSTNKTLPSVVQAPELELKLLPDHLKYVYLGDKETLPVIVSSSLTSSQEERLVEMLKQHKTAIGWTLADIKEISPTTCVHRILLEEETKPTREVSNPSL